MSEKTKPAATKPAEPKAPLDPTIEEHAAELQLEPWVLEAAKRQAQLGAGKRMPLAEFQTLIQGVVDGPARQRRAVRPGGKR